MKKLLTVTAAIVAAVFLGGPVLASKVARHGNMTVEDNGGAFTAEGVKKAKAEFEAVEFQAATHYTVVTVKDIPENKKSEFADAVKKGAGGLQTFFAHWARDMAQSRGEKGVFTLAYLAPSKFFVVTITSEATDVAREFDNGKAGALNNKIKLAFEEALKKPTEEGQAIRDRGLLSGADYLADQLKNTTVPDGKKTGEVRNNAAGGGGRSLLSWVLIIGGGLLVMWLVIGLIRALTGGGGGGGGGYGGGGGGGGFGSSLMGGMFGAMAGMYLYNSMFGGGMSEAAASSGDTGGGDYGGGADDGNFDNGGEAGGGGGDWGDGGDGAGGDWGGGGGDFGGGGDW